MAVLVVAGMGGNAVEEEVVVAVKAGEVEEVDDPSNKILLRN